MVTFQTKDDRCDRREDAFLVFFQRPSPHFYVSGGRREKSIFWGFDYKHTLFQQ